jgi:hypothetical protein
MQWAAFSLKHCRQSVVVVLKLMRRIIEAGLLNIWDRALLRPEPAGAFSSTHEHDLLSWELNY